MPFDYTPSNGLLNTDTFPNGDTAFRQHMMDVFFTAIKNNMNSMENTASLSTNGWFKDKKTGYIIQQGQAIISSGGTINFPIAFPVAAFVVIPAVNDTSLYSANAGVFGKNSFIVNHNKIGPATIMYIAVGC